MLAFTPVLLKISFGNRNIIMTAIELSFVQDILSVPTTTSHMATVLTMNTAIKFTTSAYFFTIEAIRPTCIFSTTSNITPIIAVSCMPLPTPRTLWLNDTIITRGRRVINPFLDSFKVFNDVLDLFFETGNSTL